MIMTMSANTQAALLLTSRLRRRDEEADLLNLEEYDRLLRVLEGYGAALADLLSLPGAKLDELARCSDLSAARLSRLLGRGALLGLVTSEWLNSGFWILSRTDEGYPRSLKSKLGHRAPPLLYGVGPVELLSRRGLAIVGSRDASDDDLVLAAHVAAECARAGLVVISGGARGVDARAMSAGLREGGAAVGVLPGHLARMARSSETRKALESGQLVLCSPFAPDAPFSVGAAMSRNKFIYALAEWALVVAAEKDKGGTWAGAVENLRNKWTPTYVRPGQEWSDALLRRGALEWTGGVLDLPSSEVVHESLAQAEGGPHHREGAEAESQPGNDQLGLF